MTNHPFETCRKCGGSMTRLSGENQSPLIMECPGCRHREYAEIQISPPWEPVEDQTAFDHTGEDSRGTRVKPEEKTKSNYDSSGTPVSVGDPVEGGKVVPFGWILGGLTLLLLILALFLWLL